MTDDSRLYYESLIDHVNFRAWADAHLGRGYSLAKEEGSFIDPVTRWAFKAWRAGVAHEREACAKVCIDYWHELCEQDADLGQISAVADCGVLIRARSEA